MKRVTGIDFSGHDLDDAVHIPPRDSVGTHQKSRHDLVHRLTDNEHLTLRQLLRRLSAGRGHRIATGTPEQISATIVEWFDGAAADGFNLIPPSLPGSLSDFVEAVVPILQRKGLFREDYEGRTLREHLGLPRPEWRAHGQQRVAAE